MGIVDEAFAAVPRDLWSEGPLWRTPDNLEVARDLRYVGPAPEMPPRQRLTRAAIARRREEVAKLRRAGWAVVQIAAALATTEDTIDNDLKAIRVAEGEAKATTEWAAQRAAICAALDEGLSTRAVARRLGVHPSSVYRALAARKGGAQS